MIQSKEKQLPFLNYASINNLFVFGTLFIIKTIKSKTTMKTILSIFLICILATSLPAQNKFVLSGYIQASDSKELLPFVNITIPQLKIGTTSNNYGFYSITLPKGSYIVQVSYVGHIPKKLNIDFFSDKELNIELESNNFLPKLEISSNQFDKVSETNRLGLLTLPINQLNSIPSLFGEKDVLKALQLLPGIQKGREGTSGLYVRGGATDQNLVILDDATVYNVSHLFGFFSVFNGDAIKSIELSKGGFPARYGGRLSSVLEINMKDGNKQKISGEAGIGLISSRILIEGPIIKNKSSFLVSGRRTYIDALMVPFMPKSSLTRYYFYDLNTKLTLDLDKKNKFYISGYFGRDKFLTNNNKTHPVKEGLFWQNATTTIRWNHLYNSKTFSNTAMIYSNYKFQVFSEELFNNSLYLLNYHSGIRDISFKHDIEYHPSPRYNLRIGLQITNHLFTPSAFVVKDSELDVDTLKKNTYLSFESGVYVENNFSFGSKLKINAGLRLSHFLSGNKQYLYPEPRFILNYIIKQDFSFKASYSEMNQFIHLLSNTNIGLPTDLWVPATNRIKSQHSKQISTGFAKDLNKLNLQITLEGYYKTSHRILGYKPGSSFLVMNDLQKIENNDWQDKITTGIGKSYGAEILIQRKTGKLNGWVGYTISWTKLQFNELNYGREFWARHDRRHDISIVTIYKLKKNITISGTWVFGSGNAVTLEVGKFPVSRYNPFSTLPFTEDLEFQDDKTYGETDYGEINSFRTNAYHRLDLGIQFKKKKNKYERTWDISIYNVYFNKNPFFYKIESLSEGSNSTRTRLLQVSLFPIIPSFSYNIKF